VVDNNSRPVSWERSQWRSAFSLARTEQVTEAGIRAGGQRASVPGGSCPPYRDGRSGTHLV